MRPTTGGQMKAVRKSVLDSLSLVYINRWALLNSRAAIWRVVNYDKVGLQRVQGISGTEMGCLFDKAFQVVQTNRIDKLMIIIVLSRT